MFLMKQVEGQAERMMSLWDVITNKNMVKNNLIFFLSVFYSDGIDICCE
jgi:hypothetical protein